MIPYYFTAIIFLAPTILLLDMNKNISDINYYINLLIGIDSRHLWFLWALFEIFIINFFCKERHIWVYICIAIIIASINSSFNKGISIFSIPMAIYYLPYFFLGKWLTRNYSTIKIQIFIALFVIIISGCIIKLNKIEYVDSIFSFFMNGGIVILIYSCSQKIFNEKIFQYKYVKMLLKNSFAIYLFHVPIIYITVYYFQNLPTTILLPIVGITAIMVSALIATILRKIKLQQFIGE